jgi:zinc protease
MNNLCSFFKTALLALLVVFFPDPMHSAHHPDDLIYPEYEFTPPEAQSCRTLLPNGAVAFIAEDHFLPIIDIVVYIRTGSAYDPPSKPGLSELTCRGLIDGGTTNLPGSKLQEECDMLGVEIQVESESVESRITISGLSDATERLAGLLADLVTNPAFEWNSMERLKTKFGQEIQDRLQDPEDVCEMTFNRLLYGDDHPLARRPSMQSIEQATLDDVRSCFNEFYTPQNIVFAISGDFIRNELLARLSKAFENWTGNRPNLPEITVQDPTPQSAVYIRPMPLNQGYIQMGHPGIFPDNPDFAAVEVLSFILGNGDFTSRLMRRVRSDEGLAYSVYAEFESEGNHRGVFTGQTQTKSVSVPYAISIIKEELIKATNTLPSPEEMKTAVNGMSDSLPGSFSTSLDSMCTFAELEISGRPLDFYSRLNKVYRTLTPNDILEAGKKYIHPDTLVILVVGDPEFIQDGDGVHPPRLKDFGKIITIP